MRIENDHVKSLHPETQEMLDGSDKERITYLKTDKFVMYPKAKEVLSKFEELIEEPKKTRMPCLLLVGESNSGKSSIAQKFERIHPPTDGIDKAAVPVVLVGAPDRPDSSALYDKILNAILIPFKKSDSLTKKEMEIQYHFSNIGTMLLIIDEIHNILSGSVAKQKAFMNAVKNLSNELPLSIVLIGTKDALNATNTDMQISSRFRPILLSRWKLDRDYVSLLASIERTVPLKKPSGLARNKELAETILGLSEGLLGEIISIINEAAMLAIKNGRERITIDEIENCGFIKPSQRRGLAVLEA